MTNPTPLPFAVEKTPLNRQPALNLHLQKNFWEHRPLDRQRKKTNHQKTYLPRKQREHRPLDGQRKKISLN